MNTNATFILTFLVLKLAGIGGAGLGFLLCLYCRFSPLGFKVLTLPFPYFSSAFFSIIYNFLFFILYFIALPAAEVAFFTVFLPHVCPEGKELITNLMVAGAFAGMNWFAIVFIIERFFAQLFLTAFAFGLMYGLLLVKKQKGLALAVTARYAFAIAMLFWLLWLAMTRKGWMNRKQPEYNFNGNVKNIWKRGGY